VGLAFADGRERLGRHLARHFAGCALVRAAAPRAVATALERYFAGELEALAGLARDARGSPFQLNVWRILGELGAGRTLSYTEMARRVGRPRAVRAVGAANGANPLAIVIPCHRVLGSDGSLRGYGGGLERKRWLLEHEACVLGRRMTREAR
jgi:methylated-DNA-[protein]-cysteine S-methyltransferase